MPGPRRSEMQQQAVALEREVAQLREESSTRDAENAMLKAALQREHEGYLRLQAKQNQEIDTLRAEYERQLGQLTEQVNVLRGVSDAASSEQQRTNEDANARKAQFMSLLEMERDEKNRVLAEYRFQTEALIAEQGREIQGLRDLLSAARDEEERLAAALSRAEEARRDLDEHLARTQMELSEERNTVQRSLREGEARLSRELTAAALKAERIEAEARGATQRAKHETHTAEERAKAAEQRLVEAERHAAADRQAAKEQFEQMMHKAMVEAREMREAKEIVERRLRDEVAQTTRQQAETVTALRTEIEKVRADRQLQVEDFRKQRDAVTNDCQKKTGELDLLLERSRAETEHVRMINRDVESKLHSATLRADGLQTSLAKLQSDSEKVAADARTRERDLVQQSARLEEELRAQVRAAEGIVTQLKQSVVARLEVDLAGERDHAAAFKRNAESREVEAASQLQLLRTALDTATAQRDDYQSKYQGAVSQLQHHKALSDTEFARVQRLHDESEMKLAAATRQLGEERAALESTASEAKKLRIAVNEARTVSETDRRTLQQMQQADEQHRVALASRAVRVEELQSAVSDASRAMAQLRDELSSVKLRHEAEVAELNRGWAVKLSVAEGIAQHKAALEKQLADARAELSQQLETHRESEAHWQRENLSRDEAHYAAMIAGRRESEDECDRLEAIISGLRNELQRVQTSKLSAARDQTETLSEAERRAALLQENLDQERATKARLQEELRAKDHLVAELQGTSRVLTNRLAFRDEEQRRLEHDLDEASKKMLEAHAALGKKDAAIGQLGARMRVLEARSNNNISNTSISSSHNSSATSALSLGLGSAAYVGSAYLNNPATSTTAPQSSSSKSPVRADTRGASRSGSPSFVK